LDQAEKINMPFVQGLDILHMHVIEEQETVAAHVGLEEADQIIVLLMAFAFNTCWILDLVTKLFGD
jgi:hypothetical protein